MNKKVNSSFYNPSAEYVSALVKKTGLTKVEICKRLDITEATLRNYRNGNSKISYALQFCLEHLVYEATNTTHQE
ncbi:hypothetical protein VQ643_04295 [Pseudomonas sp. F1_0610]|uniref:helix-turn-helix domain-containing protein n=1 Tax=Pseudomonas sp. F1_0610 TaxID=3114284 RepID=UPI0039C344A2